MPSTTRQRYSADWNPDGSSRIVRRSTTSGFSSARRMLSAFRWANCRLPTGFPVQLLHVRRYDTDIVPHAGFVPGVRRPRRRADAARNEGGRSQQFFGDTVKATAEFSYVSLGIGMVLGGPAGLFPISDSRRWDGHARHRRGGPRSSRLSLASFATRTAALAVMPLPANIVLRNFGFAIVPGDGGSRCGQPFMQTVSETGFDVAFIRRRDCSGDHAHRLAGRPLSHENSL